MFRKRFTVIIRYKSGHKVRLRVTQFKITKDGGRTTVNWKMARPLLRSESPLLVGVEDIESVTERRWF